MKQGTAWAKRFEASPHAAELVTVLKASVRDGQVNAEAATADALRSIAESVGEFISNCKAAPAHNERIKSTKTGLRKLGKAMLATAKKIENARPSLPFLVPQPGLAPGKKAPPPIMEGAGPDDPLPACIYPADLASIQKFLEHYGNAWTAASADTSRRPSLAALGCLTYAALRAWEQATSRLADSSKKKCDSQGRPPFRKTMKVLQDYINSTLGSGSISDQNLNTAISATIKSVRDDRGAAPVSRFTLEFEEWPIKIFYEKYR